MTHAHAFYVNMSSHTSQWEAPQGVTFPEELQQTSAAAEQQQPEAAAAAQREQSLLVAPTLTLRQFLRPLVKNHEGRWGSASLASDATQRKQLAMEMIVVLAAQFLEEDPDVIRRTSVSEDGLMALAGALLARVNW